MKRRLPTFLLSFAFLAAFCSCGGDEDTPEIDYPAPALLSSSPVDGAKDLTGSSVSVVLDFDQNVKCPSSGQSSITVNEASISRINAYGSEVTVDIDGLTSGKTYILSIPEGVISGYKDNPCEAINLTFSTKESEKDYVRNPRKSLCNANASPEAMKLYSFLLDNYGTKTISGAMGGTAWESSYTDFIHEKTGCYPGMTGFDYLFLNWPAKAWSGCPDYGDITPVKNAWDAGSIVQIGWHWAVPPAESTTDLNDYSYRTKSFGVRNALKEGSWQNKMIDSQIEKLAGYMKLLQEAKIPVLFRPLHEAAGNYTWGAWFWWGFDGSQACKELWIYLYNKLTKDYGLNNLIWVWTAQTRDGGELASVDKLEAWYPGDEYADIVGADLYVDKGTTQSAAFKLVNNSVKGGKIVVLSEFGNLLDIGGFFKEDAPWGYFMNWSNYEDGNPVLYAKGADGSYVWNNTVPDWKAALSDSHCLNRGDLEKSRLSL